VNPIKEIWFNTGKCIDYFLIEENRKPYVEELVWIQGVTSGVLLFLTNDSPLKFFYLILSPLVTVLFLRFFSPWLLLMTGKLMNGQATREELRLVISLSSIPYLLSLLYMLLALIIPGGRDYQHGIIEILIWIFVWRILIIGVAKTQRISYVFALMNIAIPGIILVVLYLIIRY
jgi:hypothetical protein